MNKIIKGCSLLLLLFSACKDGRVIDIRAVDFPAARPIVCGKTGELMVNGLPDSSVILRFDPADSGFTWQMKVPAYMSINDRTQNTVLLDQVGVIRYRSKDIDFSAYDDAIAEFKRDNKDVKFAYVKLGNLLLAKPCGFKPEQLDSLNSLVTMQKDSPLKIVMLDPLLRLHQKSGGDTGMVSQGRITVRNSPFKLSFFQVFNSKIYAPVHEHAFHVGDTIYNTTVKPLFTPFGADQFFVSVPGPVEVTFNHFYRAMIPAGRLKLALAESHSLPVSVQLKRYSNTYENTINVNDLAGTGSEDWLTVDKSLQLHLAANTWLNATNFNESKVDKPLAGWAVLPLLLVFIFGIVVIRRVTNGDLHENDSNQRESARWRRYFLLLFTCLFLLGCGRLFIAYNLSYTAPYFPLTFPTAVIVAPLVLLCVLYLWLIFITDCGVDLVRPGLLLTMVVFTMLLMTLLGILASSKFVFFWQGLRAVSWLHFAHAEPYYQIIGVLTAFTLALAFTFALSVIFISSNLPKLCFYLLLLGVMAAFLVQHNAYSVGALLIILFFFLLCGLPRKSPFLLVSEEKGPLPDGMAGKLLKQKPFFFLACLAPLLVAVGIAFIKNDPGYVINLVFFPLLVIFMLIGTHRYYASDIHIDRRKIRQKQELFIGFGMLLILYFGFLWACMSLSKTYNPLEKGRFGSRFTAFYNFERVEDFGTRESEKQAQFFGELAKYTYPRTHSLYEPVHPGISSFIDPVVKNDLSAPFGLIYQAGSFWYVPVVLLVLMWAILLYAVVRMSVAPAGSRQNSEPHLSNYGLVRLFCVAVVVCSGIWLMCSYYNILPFTGRLIYGLGQDSVAEVMETILLFGFMGLIREAVY